MPSLYALLSTLILASVLTACTPFALVNAQSKEIKDVDEDETIARLAEQSHPDLCPVTVAQDPLFRPPAPYSDLGFEEYFWFGTEHLWTRLPEDGALSGLPHNPDGYTEKLFWWSELFSLRDEPQPPLIVFGERLDGQAPPLNVSKATNASAGDIGDAMLVGVDFPSAGCWKVTGQYKKSELSFVIWIAP